MRRRAVASARPLVAALLLLFASSASPARDYPFTIPWDDAADSVTNVAPLVLDAPAGKYGAVVARGDELVFEGSSAPVHFWGMVISVSKEFPPRDPEQADAVVAKLARYGFNFVRLNGMDYARVGLYAGWRESGKLDSDWMQRFDYFLAQLKQAGIYYAVSINHRSGKYAAEGRFPAMEKAPAHKNYNVMQLFDEQAIAAALNWYTAVLSHRNRHTGLTLLEDPAHVYLSAVGEDSLFNPWLRNWQRLPVPARKELQQRFNQHLAEQYPDRGELATAWTEKGRQGLLSGEAPADGSVRIIMPEKVARYAARRIEDQLGFFDAIDRAYYTRVAKHLAGLNYEGLFTGTNNWFGYANLQANLATGNFVETHGYFDHPTRVLSPAGESTEAFLNASLLDLTDRTTPKRRHALLKRNFYRMFVQSLERQPVVISEWNHSTWSEFAYEGPVFLTAYARLQGFRLLSIHTYFGAGQDHRAEHSTRALAAIGNAPLFALSPSLSLAFVKGYIREGDDSAVITAASGQPELLRQTAEQRSRHRFADSGLDLDAAFVAKIRTRLIGEGKTTARDLRVPPLRQLVEASEAPAIVSSTGEIVWQREHRADRYFSVDAPRFQALVAGRQGASVTLSSLQASLQLNGAVTAVTLDDRPLSVSRSLLVTAVGSSRNTGFRSRGGGARRVVVDTGHAPVLMQELEGRISIVLSGTEPVQVRAVALDGTVRTIDAVTEHLPPDRQRVSFTPAGVNSPWFWLSR